VRIVRVLAPNPGVHTLEGTNTWVVGNDPAVVIDPGPDDPAHLAEVRREAGTVAAILLTHDHPDHAPGAPALARATGAPIHAYRPPSDGARLREGALIRAGDVVLRVLHTPGHTPDHVAFLLEGEGAMFTGDAVLGRGTSVIDPPEGDLVAYLRSLRRMLELRPRVLYPGHGPVVLDGPGKLREYLEHRARREEEILTALRGGRDTVPAIVEEVYAAYPRDVRPLAERSVLAHLLKLEAEGRVARRGSGDGARYVEVGPRACERCGRPVRGRTRLCRRCSLEVLQETPGP
jgi:glyoxylase-like metal-dependent hydrolase (beta-lactamase superfamily II)